MAVIKQYVNLDRRAVATTAVYGFRRTVRVPPDNLNAVRRSDRAEWWCVPVGNSNTDLRYLPRNRRIRPSENHPTLTPLVGSTSTGHFRTRITFPWVGGDKYQVKVCKRSDRRDPAKTRTLPDTFETWRKLFYTVYYMGPACYNFFLNVEARIQDVFNQAYIELERVQMIPTLTMISKVNTDPRDRFINGRPGAILNLRSTRVPHHPGRGRLPNHTTTKPYHLATIILPDVFDTSHRRHNVRINSANGTLTFGYMLFQPAGTTPLNIELGVRRARIRWTGHPAWVNVRNRMTLVSISRNPERSRVDYNFNNVAGLTNYLAAAAGNNFVFDVRTIRENHNFVGYNLGNICVLETISGVTSALQTFTHEVGHAVGQAVRRQRRWDAPTGTRRIASDVNPRWHNDIFGGEGDHCWYNARLRADRLPADHVAAGHTAIFEYAGPGNLCTMFFEDEAHVDLDGRFCIYCQPRLIRQRLDSQRQRNAFWYMYG
jgi:hypothetical protein